MAADQASHVFLHSDVSDVEGAPTSPGKASDVFLYSEAYYVEDAPTSPGSIDVEDDDQHKCVVCFQNIRGASEETQILPCGHLYHKECLADMMRTCSIKELEHVRCPECRQTPAELKAQAINLMHNDALQDWPVVVPEDTDGQREEHEQSVPAAQPEPSEAGTMTDGFLKVFHCPAVNFS